MSQTVQLPQEVINARRVGTVGNNSVFSYPASLGVHFMLFQFKKYNRLSGNTTNQTVLQSVALPMPLGLKEEYFADYDAQNLDLFGAIAQNPAVQNLLNNPSTGAVGSLVSEVGNLLSDTSNDKAILKQVLRQALRGTKLGDAVEQLTGQIVNPNIVTAFRGVPLRDHTWKWRIAPENLNDAQIFNSIRSIFRSNMLPTTGFSRAFLNYPNVVDVSIGGISTSGSGALSFSMPFKTCVIKNASFDRNPTGNNPYMRLNGNEAVIDFTLQLKEVEAFTAEDFYPTQGADPSVIGVNSGTVG